jgi:hypothetical protein
MTIATDAWRINPTGLAPCIVALYPVPLFQSGHFTL